MYERKLPIYLLLDCSESMAGPAIDAVAAGVDTLSRELKTNPLALETAHLSVITFAREARQAVPLTEVLHFHPPPLPVRPGTALGAGLRLLRECIGREVRRTTATSKGDYRPLVFLLTDGQPTDAWREEADRFRPGATPTLAHLYAIGCGPDVDLEVLYGLTDTVLLLSDLTPQGFQKLFVWLSASVRSASMQAERGREMSRGLLPPLPPALQDAMPPAEPDRTRSPYHLFLHAQCRHTQRPYLMRFARRQHEPLYDPVASHMIDALERGDADLLPPISSGMLTGVPSCPYCGDRAVGICPCGSTFCLGDAFEPDLSCPGCHASLSLGEGGNVEIRQSQG